jgi:hypothetical protein
MRKIVLIFIIAALCIFFVSCSNGKEQILTVPENWLGNFGGKEVITFDELRVLSAKGDTLSFEDLASVYFWVNFSNSLGGDYNMGFRVEGGYRLHALAGQDKIFTLVALERIWDGGNTGIDIRYNDVDEFIKANPSIPALTVDEMKALAQKHSKNEILLIELEWWEYEDEFPHNSKDPKKQALRESLDALWDTEEATLEMFTDTTGNYYAVCRKNGNVYICDTETGEKPIWNLL